MMEAVEGAGRTESGLIRASPWLNTYTRLPRVPGSDGAPVTSAAALGPRSGSERRGWSAPLLLQTVCLHSANMKRCGRLMWPGEAQPS